MKQAIFYIGFIVVYIVMQLLVIKEIRDTSGPVLIDTCPGAPAHVCIDSTHATCDGNCMCDGLACYYDRGE